MTTRKKTYHPLILSEYTEGIMLEFIFEEKNRMTFLILASPFLIIPFLLAYLIKKWKAKRKLSYLIIGLFVPLWPLILVLLEFLPKEGLTLMGTSIFALPAILFVQYLANRVAYTD